MNSAAVDARITRLRIDDGVADSRIIDLDRDEVILGRRADCGIVLSDRNVSRRHARISHRDGGTFIADLCSCNGVIIDRERIVDGFALSHGDVIHIGDFRLTAVGAGREVPPARPDDYADDEQLAPLDNFDAEAPATATAPATAPASAPATAAVMGAEVSVVAPVDPVTPAEASRELPAAESVASPAASVASQSAEDRTDEAVSEPANATPLPAFRVTVSAEALRAAASGRSGSPLDPRQLRLVFISPPEAPTPVPLLKLPMDIGSDAGCEILLPFASIRPRHLRIALVDATLMVEAIDDPAGIDVDGTISPRRELHAGSLVRLGEVVIMVARRGYHLPLDPGARPSAPIASATAKPRSLLPTAVWPIVLGLLGLAMFFVLQPQAQMPPSDTARISHTLVAPADVTITRQTAAVELALALAPVTPILEAARAHVEDVDFEEALRTLAPLRARTDLNADERRQAALLEVNAYVGLQRDDEAVAACRRAIDAAGGDPEVFHDLSPRIVAICRTASGRPDQ